MDNNVVWVNIRDLGKYGEFYWEYKKGRRMVFQLCSVVGDLHLGCGIYIHFIEGVKTVGPGNEWKVEKKPK